jgi:hypothetical protein
MSTRIAVPEHFSGSFTRLAGFRPLSQSFDSACSNIALIALGMWVAHWTL